MLDVLTKLYCETKIFISNGNLKSIFLEKLIF